MLWRLSRLLAAEALRRLARSINAAPVELDRFDKLPAPLPPSVGAIVLARFMLEIDMQRLPFGRSFTGRSSSRSNVLSFSILVVVGELDFADEVGDTRPLPLDAETGSP
jgi:hypothetical protein